jgi:hypothetical protein
MQERGNIIRILKETIVAIKRKDSLTLKNLSNQTIHTVAIYQDPDNLIVAVLVYSLGKIIERESYQKLEGWNEFSSLLIPSLKEAIKNLERENLDSFRNNLGQIRNSINKIDHDLKDYINDVFYKAGLNKAFKVYEHGLSSQKTAELLGVSLWDLASYIGQGSIFESKLYESLPIEKRIKLAEEFLK